MTKTEYLSVSRYLEVVKPSYSYIRLTPNNSIRNNNTDKIAKAISNLYASVWERIELEEQRVINFFGRDSLVATRLKLNHSPKVLYYVYIERNKVEFYFMLPSQHIDILKERIKASWNSLTMKEVKELPLLDNPTSYQLTYANEDAVSLAVDKRDNALLKSNLNIINSLQGEDKVALIYNFIPTSSYGWGASYKETLHKVKTKRSIVKNRVSPLHIIRALSDTLDELFCSIRDVFTDKKVVQNREQMSLLDLTLAKFGENFDISDNTSKKRTLPILKTQIYVQSESKSKLRQLSHAKSLVNSYDVISEDNRLICHRDGVIRHQLKKPLNLEAVSMSDNFNLMSSDECSNFIALPGRELLDQYGVIDKVDTQTSSVPEELRQGVMCLGESVHEGTAQKAYVSTDREFKFLSLIICGPNRAGKSYFIGNITHDAHKHKECSIIFDFCGNCELSDEITQKVGRENVLTIDCSDVSKLQGFGYNEVPMVKDTFEQYRNAKEKSVQLLTLINACNDNGEELAPRMERYLLSACLVVFVQGGNVKDIFDVLQNHVTRMKFIADIPSDQEENLEEYKLALEELNEKDTKTKKEIVGTKTASVSGILNRLNKLKINTYMELMLKKDTTNNINLVHEIQKPQVICLKMPDEMFATDIERDMYSLYWLSKIWLALQIRKWKIPRDKHVKVNVVIDELYQVNNTEKFLTERLSRLPKYSVKPILSCHYINQMQYIREELRSASCSYMLIAGCDKKNYKELQSELMPYTEDDLLRLPRHHSLNLIKKNNGYAKFITRLPG